MLDVQRNRDNLSLEPRSFARALSYAHFVIGLVVTTLLFFHELWFVALAVLFWYLITIGLIAGMMNRVEWCRPLLGVLFILLAVAGAVYVTKVLPGLKPERPPVISLKMLPLWGALANLLYLAGGILMLSSSRLRTATARGFKLWED